MYISSSLLAFFTRGRVLKSSHHLSLSSTSSSSNNYPIYSSLTESINHMFCLRAGLSLQTLHSPLYPLLSLPFHIFVQSIYRNVVHHLISSVVIISKTGYIFSLGPMVRILFQIFKRLAKFSNSVKIMPGPKNVS